MPDVTVNGKVYTLERFTLEKSLRVVSMLKEIRKKVPAVSKQWAKFRQDYANENGSYVDRTTATVLFGDSVRALTEAEWERADQKLYQPGVPDQAEVFFEMAPLILEEAEQAALRLIALVAIDNETVHRYVKSGDMLERLDEFANDVLRPAPLDEVMDILQAAAQLIDAQILTKFEELKGSAGKLGKLLGWEEKPKDETTLTPEAPGTLSAPPEQPSSLTSTGSPSDSSGPPTQSEPSTTTTSSDSSSPSLTPA